MSKRLLILSAAVGVLFCSGLASGAVLTRADVSPYLQAQQMVDVGGHKLNLFCTGQGSPSIILDAGEGEHMDTWRRLQPAIATFARVCSFDRAGMGFSEGGPLPRDASAIVSDEHALLERAHIPPPYVLVGHSIAGLYALLYADRYPDQVVGMVLVDPSFPGQEPLMDAASPTMKRMNADGPRAYTFCYEAAVHGKLRLDRGAAAYALCGFPPNIAAIIKTQCAKQSTAACALGRATRKQYDRPTFWAALRSEDAASSTTDSAEDIKAQRSFGSMPLIVLTAADEVAGAPFPPMEKSAIMRAWTAGHERLARLSSVGVHFIIPQSGHFIHLDRPAAVVSAVAEVASQAKR